MTVASDQATRVEKAFPAVVDGVFVATTALAQRLDLLRHLIQFSDLLLLVAGPKGAGKSALLAELLREPGDRWRVCEVTAADGADADTLLALVLTGYGLRSGHHDSREHRLRMLETHLENQQRNGLVSLIVIDDADRLGADALAMACDFAGRFEGVRPRLLLAGDGATLAPLAAVESPSAAFSHLLELPPLAANEVASYVQARFQAAGLPADSVPQARLRDRLSASPALPGAINAVLRDEASRLAPPVVEPRAPRERPRASRYAPMLLVAGAALGLTLLLYPAPDETDPATDEPASAVPTDVTTPESGSAATPDLQAVVDAAPSVAAADSLTAEEPATSEPEASVDAESVVAEMPGKDAAETVERIAQAATGVTAPGTPEASAAFAETSPLPTLGAEPPVTSAASAPAPTPTATAGDADTVMAPVEEATPVADGTGSAAVPTTDTAASPSALQPDLKEMPALPPVPALGDSQSALPPIGATVATTPVVKLPDGAEPDRPESAPLSEPAPVTAPVALPKVAPKPAAEPAPAPPPKVALEPAAEPAPASLPKVAPEPAAEPAPAPPPKVAPEPAAEPAPAPPPKVAPEPAAEPAPASPPKVAPEPAAQPAPASPPKAAPPPAAKGGTVDWLRAQPRGNFTVQLTASQNRDAAERFVRRHGLSGHAVLVRTRRDGADWYIVVDGSFSSRDAARAAIGRLDKALRRDSPWLRPIAEVLSLEVQ